jgi:hypothetical protein
METIIIKAPKKDIQSIRNFSKRTGSRAEFIDMEEIEDRVLVRIIEESMDSPLMSREEVMKILTE